MEYDQEYLKQHGKQSRWRDQPRNVWPGSDYMVWMTPQYNYGLWPRYKFLTAPSSRNDRLSATPFMVDVFPINFSTSNGRLRSAQSLIWHRTYRIAGWMKDNTDNSNNQLDKHEPRRRYVNTQHTILRFHRPAASLVCQLLSKAISSATKKTLQKWG